MTLNYSRNLLSQGTAAAVADTPADAAVVAAAAEAAIAVAAVAEAAAAFIQVQNKLQGAAGKDY